MMPGNRVLLKYVFTLLFGFALVFSIICFSLYKISWRFKNNIDTIYRIGLNNISFAYDTSGSKVILKGDGLTIVGDLHKTNVSKRSPGILLLHGSSPWGRKLALYRLMARAFAEQGFVTLKIDLRGFGDSDDPSSLRDLEALDCTTDITNAINYLSSLPYIDKNRIYLVGHSMGAGKAIDVGVRDKRVRKIVAIGPPRRVKERLKKELSAFQKRYSHDRRLDRLVSLPVFRKLMSAHTMEDYLDYLSSEKHKPIFFIDGQLEDPNDREFLKEFYNSIRHPKKYLTIDSTGHYFNSANFFGCNLLFYDRESLNKLIDEIILWLNR